MPTRSVRPPICADDRWYPSDPGNLKAQIDEFLAKVPAQPIDGELVGLISPHAGYPYSGQTAAYAYKQLEEREFERVILLGPSHREDLGARAVNRSDYYLTPLGEIEVDADAIAELSRRVGIHFVSRDNEHSLEVQLPFLQRQLGLFKLVPLMMSHPFYILGPRVRNECENLSAALAPILDNRTLLVASSDLSHIPNYEAVAYYDQITEKLISEYDIEGLIDYMSGEGECRACGDAGIITLLMAAQARGANRVHVLSRTNSGDVLGVRTPGQYTVGYMAVAVYKSKS